MNIRTFQGMTPKLSDKVFVDKSALVLGDVEIGADSSVWPMAVVRGDMHRIRIGERTSVQDGSVLHITHDSRYTPGGQALTIGSDCIIGHKVVLHGCTLHDQVLVGMGAVVMDGAIVESQVIIAAGSIVSPGKTLKSGYLYRGSPAREARELTDSEKSFFKYSAGNYVKLKDQYLSEGDTHS